MKIRRLTDTGEWTTRRYLSLLGSVLIWIIVAIDAWYLWPTQLGGDTSIVVVSGSSMEPTYFGGDLVIARKMQPSIGDVVVYAPEGLGGSQIVHRIIGGNADEGWRMQGDNNDFVDPFTPQGDEVKGVVLVHYANFGRVTVLLLNPMVWAFVLLAAMVLMLWYTGDDCDDDDEDEDEHKTGVGDDPASETEDEPDLIDRVVEGTEAAVARMVAAVAAAGSSAFAVLTRPSPAPRHAAAAPRHPAPAYLRGSAVLAVVGLVAIFGPSIASASQLIVNTGDQAFFTTVEKCDNLSLAASPTGSSQGNWYTEVTISGITQPCAGKQITVSVHTNKNSVSTSETTESTLGSQPFDVPEYKSNKVEAVIVKIGGWLFLATWSDDPSVFGADCEQADDNGLSEPCVVDVALVDTQSWNYNGGPGTSGTYQVYSVTILNTSGEARTTWSATFDLSLLPHLTVPLHDFASDNGGTVATCATMPVVEYTGARDQFNGLRFYVGDVPPERSQLCSQ